MTRPRSRLTIKTMWSFFKTDRHKRAVKRVPGFRFSGGRGETVKEAIRINAEDIQWTRDAFRKKADAKYAQVFERNPQAIDIFLGELAREYYLQERFGKKGKDWTLGSATKIGTAIQSMEICPIKGERTLLHFDLSAFFPKEVAHEDAVQRLPGLKFYGGRGESVKAAIKIGSENFELFKERCSEVLGDVLPEDSTHATEIMNGVVGEMVKMQYLEMRFGKKDKDWFCEKRAYLESTIQSQEIKLADGQTLTLFFDFSAIHGPFTQNESNTTQPTIYVDKNALTSDLYLVGRHRSVVVSSGMFGILLMTAYSGGWRGGSHILKVTGDQVSLRNFEKATLDEKEAATLGEALSRKMQVDYKTLEGGDLQPVVDLIELCKSGGFTISSSTNN